MAKASKRILISAGDPSADNHASALMRDVQHQHPQVYFMGMGGANMQATGMQCLVDASDLAAIGVVEVLTKLWRYRRALTRLKRALKYASVDLLICVDFAGFNLRLAKVAKACGVPVLYYISPQVWASRAYRVRLIRAVVDEMAVIFPFEKDFYARANVVAHYVGHPLLNEKIPRPTPPPSTANARPTIGLMPGSRRGEVARLLPILCQSAQQLRQYYPDARFVMAKASSIVDAWLQEQLATIPFAPPIDIESSSAATIRQSDVLIAASGTVTLEIAMHSKPFVLVYKVNRLTAWIARRIIQLPYIGICNILAGERLVPELLQADCAPQPIADAVHKLLADATCRAQLQAGLGRLRRQLAQTPIDCTLTQLVERVLGLAQPAE